LFWGGVSGVGVAKVVGEPIEGLFLVGGYSLTMEEGEVCAADQVGTSCGDELSGAKDAKWQEGF